MLLCEREAPPHYLSFERRTQSRRRLFDECGIQNYGGNERNVKAIANAEKFRVYDGFSYFQFFGL